jgi:hypothetical protein
MRNTAGEKRMSRDEHIQDAYAKAVGEHDTRALPIEDYYTIKDLLPGIRRDVPDVTLDEVCAARWRDTTIGHDPTEIEMAHCPWCLQVPTGYPADPDLIGPFETVDEAKAFARAHPGRCKDAELRCMTTPVVELLCKHAKLERRLEMSEIDNVRGIHHVIDEHLFGGKSWPPEEESVAIHAMLVSMGLLERVTGTESTWRNTKAGNDLHVDLLECFLGLREECELCGLLEMYGLVSEAESSAVISALGEGEPTEAGLNILKNAVQKAYKRASFNPALSRVFVHSRQCGDA